MKQTNSCESEDLAGSCGSFLRIWGLPIAIIIIAPLGTSQGWWPLSTEIILWSVGVAWIGIACYINGKRCSRLHCKILGVALPILGIIGILVALNILAVTTNTLNLIFWILLIGSFVPEFFWKKYL